MKKITAFFMALFPFLVIGVLFATGLISKNFVDKTVQRLEMKFDAKEVQKSTDDEMDYTIGDNVRVIPEAAKDPTVYWTSKDESIATVTDKEKGTLKINKLGYGDVELEAVAKTNQAAKATCTLKVFDTKIHAIEVTNREQAEQVSAGSQLLLQTKTIPSERIEDPTLIYAIVDPETHTDFQITQNGLLTVGANANGQQCRVTITSHANPNISTYVDVLVGASVETVGFKDDGNTLIQENSYDLWSDLVTAPRKLDLTAELAKKYFKFYSSNEAMATIDDYGVVHFTENYIPGTYVEFTAKFSDLNSISCSKKIASSQKYYSNVSFDQGYSKTLVLDLTNPVNLSGEGLITYTTYPSFGDTSRLHLETSNKDVISVENNKFVAHKAGKATLTIKADVTQKSSISDKIDVTILNQQNQRILNEEELDIGQTNYYPLRKSLIEIFKNKQISWSIPADTTVAELDEEHETLYFKEKGSVVVTAQYTDGEIEKNDQIKLICNNSNLVTVAADSSETPIIEAGQVFKVTNAEAQVELTKMPSSFIDLGNKTYIAKQGCGDKAFDLSASDLDFSLIVTQPVVDFTSPIDWSHYTTNLKEVNVGASFKPYPSTATYMKETWTGSKYPVSATISYEYTAEDLSVVDIDTEKNVLTFSQPTTVTIKTTSQDVTRTYYVTSYAGGNGKFSLAKLTTNELFSSGMKINLAPDAKEYYYIDNFFLSDVSGTATEKMVPFKVSTLSDNKIVTATMYPSSDNKVCFEITGNSNGTDTIAISNGSYTFYIYVTVSTCIVNTDLYCLGNKISKDKEISVHSTTDLLLSLDFTPVVARDQILDFKFEGNSTATWQQKPGQVNLSQGSSGIDWNTTGTNTLTITRPASTDPVIPAKELAKYTFKYSSDVPKLKIKYAQGSEYYLAAKQYYTAMEIETEDSIYNQTFFKENFVAWDGAEIYGKYIVAPAPAAGASQKVVIKNKSGSKEYNFTIIRDIVSKIVLPKNNNNLSTDQKGLQRVTTYGTRSLNKGETQETNVYKLEVNLYDDNDKIIQDVATKKAAMSTLVKEFKKGAGKVTINDTTGNLDLVFDTASDFVYTWEEMFNNKFVNETNKNQLFAISTKYGQVFANQPCYAQYSFVVVDALNVYSQEGIASEAKKPEAQRKIVLQTDFGAEGQKETEPFELNDFSFQEVYGNGHILCFDSIAKQLIANKSVHIQHALNIDLHGCKYDTFSSLENKCMHMATSGGLNNGDSDTVAYCKLSNFFQDMTIWTADGMKSFTHIKNTLFYNEQEYCRVGLSISNPGNTTLVENSAFFNSSKISIMCNKSAVLQLKGSIDVYNFHGQDMFDSLGMGPEVSTACWRITKPILESAGLLQSTEYGSHEPVTNAYLLTTIGGTVQFYDHTDASGKDIFVSAQHGSEKAANYLMYGAGIPNLCDLWTTVKPPLPLQFGHSPAYLDEFHFEGEERKLNYDVWNLLQLKVSRW